MVAIGSGHVVVDNVWLWRADHGVKGLVYNSSNYCATGLVVDGSNVTAYGVAVEHTLADLLQWNGDDGRLFFYQSEFPYDVTQVRLLLVFVTAFRFNCCRYRKALATRASSRTECATTCSGTRRWGWACRMPSPLLQHRFSVLKIIAPAGTPSSGTTTSPSKLPLQPARPLPSSSRARAQSSSMVLAPSATS